MASQAPVVTQADLDAYIASYQKAQADQAAALARAQATGLSDQYTQLYGGMDIVPGMTQGILSNLGIENPYVPVYSLIGSESVGNDLANERMQFAPTPGVSYRLVNNATGETTTATTPEEIRDLIAQSNALSAAGGKKADLAIESNQTGAWSPVFTDAPNPLFNDITKLALAGMIAATGAGLLQPGGLGGLGAAGTSGAGAGVGATGSLAGAGLSSLPANLAAIQAGANAALAGAGLGTAAATGAGLGALASGGIEALPGITVTGATGGSILPAVGTIAAMGGAAAATGGAGTSGASGATNANQNLTKDQFGNVVDETGAIVSTGGGGSTSLLPAAGAAAGAAGVAAATGGGGAGATDATITQNTQNAVDTAYQNAQTGAAGDTAAAGYNGMGAGPFVAPGAGATVGGGVFGTGLSLSEFATLTGLGIEAVKALVGGGGSGGTGTGTPYVSPFGAGPAIGGADFRVNPNIQDYERYGFGGEATFFRPEYNKLISSGASMGGAPVGGAATTTTPTYTPLIGGTTTGGTTAVTKQERPAGFTGVVSGQQVGDTQVVDGTTWSYGGDKAGWQMQYTNDAGQTALLPGNGATNVSSFANNPTVAVNQPYFAQNTANIPGWAETYQGFQRGLMSQGVTGDAKAAAERELFTAIETQPFANPQALVDYARTVYNKYTAPTPAATSTNTGGILGALTNAGTSTQSPLNMTQEQKTNFINALAPGYDPNQPMVWNGPYVPSGNPMPIGNLPEGAANVARGLIG